MLKKIAVCQLRLGMHLHRLEGSWIAHPFWKTRFVIDDPDDLRRLHECGVAECWIDVALGRDLPAPAPPAAAAAAAAVPQPRPARGAAPVQSPAAARELDAELREAASVCERGRAAVKAMFTEARMGRAIAVDGCLPLVSDIADSVLRHPGALVSLARLKTRDDYSYMHSVAVCALMVALARQLGMGDAECHTAGLAGLLHDLGKAAMPLDVLNKPGQLTEAEYAVIRTHPEHGHAMLADGDAPPEALDVVLHHHERVDGTGYPHRLSGDALTLLARMGAVCDVYDAITSNRPYKSGWDPADSIARMAGWKGHFDSPVFAAFVQSLGIYPTGSLVRLESGRVAVVLEQNAHDLVAPVVKAFYSARSGLRIAPLRIDLSAHGCNDRIVGRDNSKPGNFGNVDEMWAGPDLVRRMHAH